jgi:snurportin-1
MVAVPEGRRALVVAGNGETRQYAKSGYQVRTFPSLLPGGLRGHAKQYGTTILDCIFNEVTGTFYVLDLMMWDNFSYYDCDTEFRFYWLSCKLSETAELQSKSRENPFKFRALEPFSCSESSLQTALMALPSFDPLATDGLLFYHKRVHYLPGSTPLVGWLKGYMATEMFGLRASDAVMGNVPSDYNSMKKFIAEFDQKEVEKQKKHAQRNVRKANQMTDMDTTGMNCSIQP